MKKRLLSILLIGVLSFSLYACGDPATEPTAQTEETEQQTTEEETDTQTPETEEPQETEETETAQEPETTEEVATEETTTPEETTAEEIETAETDTEQTAEPEYTYTDMSATMYATQTVNVRTAPSTDGEKVGALSANQEITITGQCNETKWFRFEYNGSTAYVSNNYIIDTKIEVAAAEPAPAATESAPAQAAPSTSASSSLPAGVVDLTTLPREQWVDRGDWLVYVHGVWNEYPPVGDLGPLMRSFNERYPDAEVRGGGCVFIKELGICDSDLWFDGEYESPEWRATDAYYHNNYKTGR